MAPAPTPPTGPEAAHDCWGCGQEPSVDGSLGLECRAALAARRRDPAKPRLDAHIALLDDVYNRLCWNCQVEICSSLSGLCPGCEADIRR